MGDGAADSAGEGEAGVQLEAAELAGLSSLGLRLDLVNLRGHCESRDGGGNDDAVEWRWGSGRRERIEDLSTFL